MGITVPGTTTSRETSLIPTSHLSSASRVDHSLSPTGRGKINILKAHVSPPVESSKTPTPRHKPYTVFQEEDQTEVSVAKPHNSRPKHNEELLCATLDYTGQVKTVGAFSNLPVKSKGWK